MLKPTRICIHWTAGGHFPNAVDFQHYHFVVDALGNIHKGRFTPEANVPRNGQHLSDKEAYARHCGGGNSFAIGIAACGREAGHPQALTQTSVEALCKQVAVLCKHYGIPINEASVYTHYEFGQLHPSTSSRGKIDITNLAWMPRLQPADIGDYLRGKVQWYLDKLT
jgi:hypothetical protein